MGKVGFISNEIQLPVNKLLQAVSTINSLALCARLWASSRDLSVLTRTTVSTIAYGRSLRIEIFTLTGRGGHTTHHHKVPQRHTHKHTQNITKTARLAAESSSRSMCQKSGRLRASGRVGPA